MTRRQYRKRWLMYRARYERRGFTMFRKSIRQTALSIPFGNITEENYIALVELNLSVESVQGAYFEFYETIGLAHGKRVGASINKQLKSFTIDTFVETFRNTLQQWVLSNAGANIISVRQTLVDYIVQYIANSIGEQKDIRTIARELQKHIKSRNFYRWQIDRIVRTETTAAANYGAIVAGDDSGVLLQKEWISSNDPRTRQIEKGDQYDHVDMDGIRVDKNVFFNVQDDFLRFPGDPTGRPGNVINCRCTVAMVPKRDSEGNLIFRRG